MYIQCCVGGHPMPIKKGKYELLGFRATISDPTAASRMKIIDDSGITDANFGRILPSTYQGPTLICDAKGVAGVDANLEVLYPEPLKLRYGISVVDTDNILGGTLMAYVR